MKQSHKDLQLLLMCSVAYYHRFESLIEDHEYDAIAKSLLKSWDDWQDHQHAYLVTKEDLAAGTMCSKDYKDYPNMVLAATEMRIRQNREKLNEMYQ